MFKVNTPEIRKIKRDMNHQKSNADKHGARHQFCDSDGTLYAFDPISGLYIPESDSSRQIPKNQET